MLQSECPNRGIGTKSDSRRFFKPLIINYEGLFCLSGKSDSFIPTENLQFLLFQNPHKIPIFVQKF